MDHSSKEEDSIVSDSQEIGCLESIIVDSESCFGKHAFSLSAAEVVDR
jgi:hypothetical protein